jgi:hypothetical protein
MSSKRYKIAITVLALALVGCLVLLAARQSELARIRMDIRFARDIVRSFQDRRDFALKGGTIKAASELYRLQIPPETEPFHNVCADFVDRERRRTITDIITFLRSQTGKDLGDSPGPWILAFGDDTTRRSQMDFFESH